MTASIILKNNLYQIDNIFQRNENIIYISENNSVYYSESDKFLFYIIEIIQDEFIFCKLKNYFSDDISLIFYHFYIISKLSLIFLFILFIFKCGRDNF